MSSHANSESFYLELNKNIIRFEPVSKANEVFFDESNKQVFAVRASGTMGVVVKGPDEKSVITFRMEDRGPITSMRFSPDRRILGVQRSNKSVEFINFKSDMTTDQTEYSQACKGKSTQILGFCWPSTQEVIFITDHGVEHYQIQPERRSLKSLKTVSLQVNWFTWLAGSNLLLLSSAVLGNQLHPLQFKGGLINRMPKFEVDLPVVPKPPKLSLFERDVCLAVIYDQLYIVVLRHQPRPAAVGAEIVLYQLLKESPARRTHVLHLEMSGRFALNFVDNLVVVHHQTSKTSVTFDIKLGGESDGFVKTYKPVLSPLAIKPFTLAMPTLNLPVGTDKMEVQCELYSANWIVFQPDIIIDAKLGCLWYIQLNLQPLVSMVPDTCQLIQLLLNRAESKMVILSVCRDILIPGHQVSLPVLATIYDMLNQVYRAYLDIGDNQNMTGEMIQTQTSDIRYRVIDQSDMYTHVFSCFEEVKDLKYKFQVAVLIEYIRSLNQFNIPVQHYLYEMIINTLVHNNRFYQLHQFLQYHVLCDSKPLACLMLSLESHYPPAYQLALDMLKRLQTANEEIIEVLLSKLQLLPALRFIRSVGIVDTVSSRKFLEAALNANDSKLFYTVFKFFEQRNVKLRSNPRFQQGEHCEQYVRHFESLFGTEALSAVSASA